MSDALGTTVGGILAQFANYGGLLGLFALSSGTRLLALLPLIFVQEDRQTSERQRLWALLLVKSRVAESAEPVEAIDPM